MHTAREDSPGERRIRGSWPLGWRDLCLLVAVTAILIAVTSAVGLVLVEVFDGSALLEADERIAKDLEEARTSTWNSLSLIGSWLSETLSKVVVTAIVCVFLLVKTRRWLEALVVSIPLVVEAIAFVVSTAIVGRPRPDVVQLDESPVSSSFPSGHVAAAVAYSAMVVVLFAMTSSRFWRTFAVIVAILVPPIVAAARMYRGMHHLTDVVAGILLGIASVILTLAVVLRAGERRGQTLGEHERPREVPARPNPTLEVAT